MLDGGLNHLADVGAMIKLRQSRQVAGDTKACFPAGYSLFAKGQAKERR